MRSKWYESKEQAIALRRSGRSIRKIEKQLGIPRSTLSGWFKQVELSESQKEKLRQDWMNSLAAGRKKAVIWHNAQKEKRIARAEREALATLAKIDSSDLAILELALAILYLGEGSKKTVGTALGSSDPMILRFFISVLQKVYRVDKSAMRVNLHLRADQNITTLKRYWSRQLDLPLDNFRHVSIDIRTRGSKTYPTYKGVCNVYCGNVAIQRRLIFLSRRYCSKVAEGNMGS